MDNFCYTVGIRRERELRDDMATGRIFHLLCDAVCCLCVCVCVYAGWQAETSRMSISAHSASTFACTRMEILFATKHSAYLSINRIARDEIRYELNAAAVAATPFISASGKFISSGRFDFGKSVCVCVCVSVAYVRLRTVCQKLLLTRFVPI